MIDVEKLNSAKAWIEKLANGINPLNDELVKDDDLINNVHISRCLFYVSELLGEINIGTSVERRSRKPFFLSKNDAVNIPNVNIKQVPIIKGDAKSISIAAASIVAKVTRDRLMVEMDRVYPGYHFAENKGYGSQAHIEALKKYGPTPIHRRSFIRNICN